MIVHRAVRGKDARGSANEVSFSVPITRTLEVTSLKGVLRGMHFQDWRIAPLTKIFTVELGSIQEVVLDLKNPSAQSVEFELRNYGDEEQVFLEIPPHCAHGYLVLSDIAIVRYFFNASRDVAAERIIRWDTVGAQWQTRGTPILSDRDREAPSLAEVLGLLTRPI